MKYKTLVCFFVCECVLCCMCVIFVLFVLCMNVVVGLHLCMSASDAGVVWYTHPHALLLWHCTSSVVDVGECYHIWWTIVENRQLQTVDRVWSSNFGLVVELTIPDSENRILWNVTQPQTWKDSSKWPNQWRMYEISHLKSKEFVLSGFIENSSRLIGFSVNMEGHMGQEWHWTIVIWKCERDTDLPTCLLVVVCGSSSLDIVCGNF
jgi:hypothetical protein